MITKIENIICSSEGLIPSEIHVKSRKQSVREARQIIMYFAKQMTNKSLADIGNYFGRDHSTAHHAIKTITNMITTDQIFAERMLKYENRLKLIKVDKMISQGNDILRPLEFEVLRLEQKISDLRQLVSSIKTEIGEVAKEKNIQIKSIGSILMNSKGPIINTFKSPYISLESANNQPHHGFREHNL